jgi:hypothetical protein
MKTTEREGGSGAKVKGRGGLWRAARVGGYALVVVAGFGACSLKSAAARTRDSLDEVGGELLDNAAMLGDSTPVTINGAIMFGAARDVPLDLDAALDRIEGACREPAAAPNPSWLTDSLEGPVPAAGDAKGPTTANPRNAPLGLPQRLERIGIDRRRGDGTGSIVCVQPERAPDGIGAWMTGIRAFAASGDLGSLGKVRYVVARPSGPHRTLVAGIWTEGSFNVRQMVSSAGDAPGNDILGVPRPASSRRILSAEVVGGHYGVHSYECGGSIAEELAAYDQVMLRSGWQRTAEGLSTAKQAPAVAAHLDETSRAFVQRGVAILVDATELPDGHTRIDIVQMGGTREKHEPMNASR